jgi:hypothetical protein
VPSIVNGQLVQGDGTAAEQIPDFWRVGTGATGALPDGTTDVTDVIAHQSDIFVGLDALMRVGHGAGNVDTNTAVGNLALQNNINGARNTAIGFGSLSKNTSGNNNVAIGRDALFSNTSGTGNIANGLQSLFSNTIGNNNVANGSNALYYNTQNNENTALGCESFNAFSVLATGVIITASSSTQVTLSVSLVGGWAVGDDIYVTIEAPFFSSISGFYQGIYKIINATTLEVSKPNTVLGTSGTVNSVQIRQGLKINNATAAGFKAEPTASNQVKLGDTRVTEINLGNNLIIDVAAILGAADGTQLVKRIVGGIHKITI